MCLVTAGARTVLAKAGAVVAAVTAVSAAALTAIAAITDFSNVSPDDPPEASLPPVRSQRVAEQIHNDHNRPDAPGRTSAGCTIEH
jgi:hypothetical protein